MDKEFILVILLVIGLTIVGGYLILKTVTWFISFLVQHWLWVGIAFIIAIAIILYVVLKERSS